MKTTKLLVAVCLLLSLNTYAQQTWQWGKVGGSRYSTDAGSNPVSEWIQSMAMDPGGNTYALVRGANRIYAGPDSSSSTNSGYALVSWACDGHVRWLKTLGPSYPGKIATDTLGGVYMMGGMDIYYGNYFDVDTVIPPQNVYKRNYILKYDTAGHLKWLRFPDANLQIAGFANWPHFSQLQVSPNGEVHILAYLSPGTHAGGAYTVNDNAYHVLKYTKDGTFTAGVRLPVSVPIDINNMPENAVVEYGYFLHDPVSGRYYIAGDISSPYSLANIFIGNDTLRTSSHGLEAFFLASFDAQGSLKWLRRQDTADWGNLMNATLDRNGRIYLCGQIGKNQRFNGATFTAPVTSMAYVVCMDTNGVNKWTSSGYSVDDETPFAGCMAMNKDGVFRVAGTMFNKFSWGSYSAHEDQVPGSLRSNSGMYLATLDPATGICTGMDTVRNKLGYGTEPQFMNTDRNGNFFIGGMLGNEFAAADTLLTVGPDKLIAIGGTTDFFMIKYGTASCKAPLITAVSTAAGTDAWRIYPNPVYDQITISGINGAVDYVIYNSMGSKLQSGSAAVRTDTINTGQLPAGFYYLQITSPDGAGKVFKFLKY